MSEMRTYECWVYDLGCRADMVSKNEADKVIVAIQSQRDAYKAERDSLLHKITELKADYKEALDRLQTANLIKDEQKAKVDELLMKIVGLEKLVETADKVVKQKGGFTVKDVSFNGTKLEGAK